MNEELTLAQDLVPANVHYMQQMMYLAQGFADWDDDFDMITTGFNDDLEGV